MTETGKARGSWSSPSQMGDSVLGWQSMIRGDVVVVLRINAGIQYIQYNSIL